MLLALGEASSHLRTNDFISVDIFSGSGYVALISTLRSISLTFPCDKMLRFI